MKKPFIKIITILSIIFISFFIEKNSVFADEKCYWISPLTYMNEFGLPSNIQSKIEYESNEGSYKGKYGPDTSAIVNLTSYRLKYNGSKYDIGYSVETLPHSPKGATLNEQGGYNIYLDETYKQSKKELVPDTTPGSDCSKYKYAKATVSKEKHGYGYLFNITISGVKESEYINYLRSGGQFKNLFNSKNTYGIYSDLNANGTNDDFSGFSDQDYDGTKQSTFAKMIEKTGGEIIFVNTKLRENYPTDHLKQFKQMLKHAESDAGVKLSEDEQNEALKGLSQLIDIGDTNNITYTKAYFDATHEAWKKYMDSDYVNGQRIGEEERKERFSLWFNKSTARYVFENDFEEFLKYWKFIYGDCTTGTCDLNADETNDDTDRKINKNIIIVLESCEKFSTASACESKLYNDPCVSLCTGNSTTCISGPALTQCMSSNTYKTCKTCADKCGNIQSAEAKTACYDNCTSGKYSTVMGAVNNEQREAANAAANAALELYKIYKAKAPSLDIEFTGYKVKCKDVKVFNTLYKILEIAAPIAVIIFGSLDYAKAVIASDVEKMEKSKKKFPKRLILLVLFVLVPIIIKIILNLFSESTGIKTGIDLMRCIVLGK